ncbi:iron ABC transporter permease [Clostridium sediminicola]|uniref:FecCD family ABC transporter permease n=1 Tax=Clostridium sediminicola TaxID=3114879 RepID=UPI0031F21F0E
MINQVQSNENKSINVIHERMIYRITVISVLCVICVTSIIVSTSFGACKISFVDVFKALFKYEEGLNRQIIWTIRFPRTLVAGLVGMCLALSGAILQGIMKNPLASPNIIGVSSGAGIAGIIILILFPSHINLVTPFSFIGAFVTTMLIYILAWQNGVKPMRMILAGVAVSAFLGAMINGLMIFFPDRVQGVVDFMVGGLAAKTWKHFRIIWPYAVTGFILSMFFSKKLNILMLGDEMATSLGINVERIRFILIAVSSLLAGAAVSIVGLLGFVGLIVPHITRMIIGSDYRYLLPASALTGASLLMLCDTFARTIIEPVELPVGIIMAMLGAPFFLYLLRGGLRKKC